MVPREFLLSAVTQHTKRLARNVSRHDQTLLRCWRDNIALTDRKALQERSNNISGNLQSLSDAEAD